MGLKHERATWITLPAGSPQHRNRISVLVSPVIEGEGRAQLKELPRFRSWPSFVNGLAFKLAIDGQSFDVTPIAAKGLERDEKIWNAVFHGDFDVDLLDLDKVAGDVGQTTRLPIAPPTAAAAAALKARYAGEVADPGAMRRAAAARMEKVAFTASSVAPKARVKSWSDYIQNLAPADSLPNDGFAPLATAASVSARRDRDPLKALEDFHERPPLRVFPHLLRDEREIPRRVGDAGGGGELRPASLATGQEGLQEIPATGDRNVWDFKVPKPPPPDGDVQPQSFGPASVIIAAKGEDRVSGVARGLTLREDDEIRMYSEGANWNLRSFVVQIHPVDNGAVLHARHLKPAGSEIHGFEFRLPPKPAPGFTITIRSLEKEQVVVTATGFRDEVTAGLGKIYRWNGTNWVAEREDRQDFHARVASLRAYPNLLRRLGLILDFELPADASLNREGTLRIIPQGQDLDFCPATAYEHSPQPWWLLPRCEKVGADAQGPATPYAGGFLSHRDGRSRFKIVQLDTDTAALKLAAVDGAEAAGQVEEEFGAVTAVSLDLHGDPHQTHRPPTLRQHGIALCDTAIEEDVGVGLQRARALTQRLCRATGLHDPALLASPLYAEDLVQGFRVDVQRTDAPGSPWRSLCQRRGRYVWSDPETGKETCWVSEDEGVIAPAADEVGDPGSIVRGLRLPQALFRWDGWSLAAERPGLPYDETGPHLAGPGAPDAAPVRVQFEAMPGSLERLRLGARYSFRLRLVDLAGNGFSLTEANGLSFPADDLRRFNSGCYERPETIDAPILVPCSMPGPGEGNDQWVIRSTEASGAGPRSWLLLPPVASPAFVELHGVLDGMAAEESWHLLRSHEDLPPRWDPDSRGYDPGWVARYSDPGEGLPYLPDPLCQAATFRNAPASAAVAALSLGDCGSFKADYPGRIAQRLVRLAAGREPEVRPTREGLEFRLPPGRIAQIEMSSCPPKDALAVLGLVNWCRCDQDPYCDEVDAVPAARMQPADVKTLHGACCAGEVGLVTPSRLLKLVHAIERPLPPSGRKAPAFVTDRLYRFDNAVQVLSLEEEGTGDGEKKGVGFKLDGKVWIDTPSTGKLDFRLNWTEPVDEPQSADFYEIDRSAPGFQVNVPLATKDLTLFPSAPGASGCGKPPCLSVEPFRFTGTVRFEDGRHRRVRLQYDATSRFVDCYERLQDEPADRFLLSSESVDLHVPARVPPEPPSFFYAVPTFSFTHERRKKEVTARRLGGLRLYLRRGWFSSGPDEMLAVVFAQSRTVSLPPPLNDLVSAWGEDPIWATNGRRLPERPLLADVSEVELPVTSVVTPLRFELPEDEEVPEPKLSAINVELALAAYTPRLDPAKNLLFVDVGLRVPAYFTFIRLGLARYQPYALAGRELSAIVPAVFCQLMPDVTVTAVPRRRGCWEVSVVAPAGASPSVEEPLEPQRAFRVFKADHGDDPDRLRRGAWPAGDSVELKEIVVGDDGKVRWSGVINTGWMGCGDRLYVMEEQRWYSGTPRTRVVGCIPLELHFQAW